MSRVSRHARRLLLAGVWCALATATAWAADAGRWRGAWENRFEETRGEWVIELPDTQGEVAGVVRIGDTRLEAKGRREGAWLELSWTDAEGRITQARGVVSGASWKGTTISGGGGRLVEYGRFSLKRE